MKPIFLQFSLFIVLGFLGLFPSLLTAEEKPELSVAISELPPMIEGTGSEALGGFDIEFLGLLARELGVTLSFKTLSFQELLPAVEAKTVDLAASGLTITAAREDRIDFSHHYLDSGIGVLIPEDVSSSAQQVFLQLWSWTSLRLVLGFISLTMFFGFLLYLVERGRDQINDRIFPGLFDAAWVTWATATTVGFGDKTPESWFGRLIVSIAGFVGIAYFGLIAGHVSSILTAERLSYQIQTSSDLVSRDVATVEGSTSVEILAGTGARVQLCKTFDECALRLEAGRVDAVVFDSPVLKHYKAHHAEDDFVIVNNPLRREYYGLAFPEGSEWKSRFDIALLKLRENGELEDLQMKYFGEV